MRTRQDTGASAVNGFSVRVATHEGALYKYIQNNGQDLRSTTPVWKSFEAKFNNSLVTVRCVAVYYRGLLIESDLYSEQRSNVNQG